MTKIRGMQRFKGQVCIKITNGIKEVSLALDDSCRGVLPTTFIRSTLCIFEGEYQENNVTKDFFETDEVLGADGGDLLKALKAIGLNNEAEKATEKRIASLEKALKAVVTKLGLIQQSTCHDAAIGYANRGIQAAFEVLGKDEVNTILQQE